MPPPPPRKGVKATLLKLFIMDVHGGYAGEYVLDENCVAEYGDVLAAVPEAGLGDQETIFLGEWKATAIHGDKMSLVAISKGQLGPEEITWAKAALVAAESQLAGTKNGENGNGNGNGEPAVEAPPPGPDKGVMESLARALDEREAQLKERETAVQEMAARTQLSVDEYRQQMEAQVADLKAKLAAAAEQHKQDLEALEGEREKVRQQMEAIAKTAVPAPVGPDPKVEAMRRQNESDRKYLQNYALDLLSREEGIRDKEAMLEEESANLAKAREDLEAVRAEIDAAKSAPPSFDVEAARREIEQRVKILQQKSFELLQREEKLRKRAAELDAVLKES